MGLRILASSSLCHVVIRASSSQWYVFLVQLLFSHTDVIRLGSSATSPLRSNEQLALLCWSGLAT
jgi:hypothetical protein